MATRSMVSLVELYTKTLYEEIIEIITQLVIPVIINEVKIPKNYSAIVDSSGYISYVEQLSSTCSVTKLLGIERLIKFLDNNGHKALEL